MKKDYAIQHNYLFNDLVIDGNAYRDEIGEWAVNDVDYVISFSTVIGIKTENSFAEFVCKKIPNTLFSYVLVLDVWPSENEPIMIDYAKTLLGSVLSKLSSFGIEPLVVKSVGS